MGSIRISGLDVRFGSLHVIRDLNLEVNAGEFVVLLGPSGCGKSTLLNVVAGLQEAGGGHIEIDERDVTLVEPKDRGIGMVFQSYALYPRMSVRGNLSFGLRMARTPKADIARRVARTAELLQIGPLLDRRPSQLSGGQRQRVAIGRALVRDVDVYLFDEPLSNLDAKLRAELRVELKRLHGELGSTMIYVTHDQVEAMSLADRIAVMHSGIIQQFDSPKVIYQNPTNLFVAGFIGSPPMNFIEGVVQEAGNSVRLRLKDNSEVNLEGYEFRTAPDVGRTLLLGIRPEHLNLDGSAGGHQGQSLLFTASLAEPIGANTVLWGDVADTRAAVHIDSRTDFILNRPQPAHFEVSDVSLFDPDTGDRI